MMQHMKLHQMSIPSKQWTQFSENIPLFRWTDFWITDSWIFFL
jgi:hypothetical protein